MKRKNKKAQILLLINIIIGVAGIVLGFLIFFLTNSTIESIENDHILEVQNSAFANSYTGAYQKMDSKSLKSFSDLVINLKENDENFIGHKNNIKNKVTFDGQITLEETEIGQNAGKQFKFNPNTHKVMLYKGTPIFFSFLGNLRHSSITPTCPDKYLGGCQNVDGVRLCKYERSYCILEEVLTQWKEKRELHFW